CHNHKFDPIAQKEYFQFYAFLNSDDEPEIEVPDEKVTKKREEILSKVAKIEDDLIAQTPDLQKRLAEWEREAKQERTDWTPLTGGEIFASFGVKFDNLEDGSFLTKGDNSTSNNYKVTVKTKLKNITGFKLEFITDANLPRSGPGRAPDGSFYVSEFSAEAAPMAKPEATKKVLLTNATTDFNHPDFPVENVIDGNMKTHWYSDAGNGRRNQDRKMVFATTEPVGFDGGTTFNFQLAQKFDETIKSGNVMPNIGRFRILVTTAANPKADPLPTNVRCLMADAADKRTKEQQREIFSYFRTTVEEFSDANKQIEELMKDWPYGATTMALAARGIPRETHLFRRGDWKRPAETVTPGTPAVLPAFPADAPRNRLGLAK
ncbi:MAG: hypothetical protein ACRD82_23400, partial [Blastocatellia bacterium]